MHRSAEPDRKDKHKRKDRNMCACRPHTPTHTERLREGEGDKDSAVTGLKECRLGCKYLLRPWRAKLGKTPLCGEQAIAWSNTGHYHPGQPHRLHRARLHQPMPKDSS
jgi:hypothetical protein